MSAYGTTRHSPRRTILVTLGVIADIGRFSPLMARSRMTRSGHQSNGLAHLSEERPSSHVFQNMHGAACAVDEVEPTMLVGADVI
jgi:hypothetical protein